MVQELRTLGWDLSLHPARSCPVWDQKNKKEVRTRGGRMDQASWYPQECPMPCLPTPNHSVCALSRGGSPWAQNPCKGGEGDPRL